MVAIITRRTPHEEASAATCTFNIVDWIRARRMQWLGHILRMDDSRLIKKAVRLMYTKRQPGDLLMDAPASHSWSELCQRAAHRDAWRERVRGLRSPRIVYEGSQVVPAVDMSFTVS